MRALPSVMTLIESNANAVLHLPLDCICELFYNYVATLSDESSSKISSDKFYSVSWLLCLEKGIEFGHDLKQLAGSMGHNDSVVGIF